MDLSGEWRACPADDELRRGGIGIDVDDRAWPTLPVPSHWQAHAALAGEDGPVLYRTRFEHPRPQEGERLFVTFDGIFSQADVWLDGAYLGDPEGYFVPHSFDVTSLLRLGEEHVLAVEVTSPPQREGAKRNLTGAFQDRRLAGSWNPGGIWRPVHIDRTGPVRIDRCRVLCRDANDKRAHLRCAAALDADGPRRVTISTFVDGVLVHEVHQSLARGVNNVRWNLDVPNPALWWPWTMGDQPLHDITIEVVCEGVSSDRRTSRIGLRELAFEDWVFSVNGERLHAKGALLPPSRLALGDATPGELRHDVELAREVGLDLLRVHRHIARPETYAAADELGMLLWQDLPMHGTYARSVRKLAVEQARAAVDLLGHHPSIVLWCGHDGPAASTLQQQLPSWNKTILDRWVKRAFERADESRPALAHSGVAPHVPQLDGTDAHLRFGWDRGDERDLGGFAAVLPRMVRFVTGFGSGSVPDSSDFAQPERWPDLDWSTLSAEHGYDPERFERYVSPAAHGTFDGWRAATQRYQARLLRHQIETLRRLKYRPSGGFCFAALVDAAPAISTSILDHRRRPKLAYHAVTEACRPVIVVADQLPTSLAPGDALALDVHVVSDLRRALEQIECTATLRWPGGSHAWVWHGDAPADSCVRVGTVQFVVPAAPGELWLDLAIVHGDEVATNRYESVIVQ